MSSSAVAVKKSLEIMKEITVHSEKHRQKINCDEEDGQPRKVVQNEIRSRIQINNNLEGFK